jgi:hypothetical protein
MNITDEHKERMAKMTFATVYPLYVNKVERLQQVISWLTGFSEQEMQEHIEKKSTFRTFFTHARLNPNADMIKGLICGYRIEEIDDPLTKQVRYLDKLVDELAKGKKMEKILRHP